MQNPCLEILLNHLSHIMVMGMFRKLLCSTSTIGNMSSSYRRVLRSLGPLARRPGRSAWNPQPAPPGSTLRPRAHTFVLSAARHAFETTDDPTTTTTAATNSAVNFLNSCKGTTDTALCNRIAILNTSTLARQHRLKKSWNPASSQKDVVQRSVTNNVQHFLSTQVTSLNQHLGKFYVARTSHSAAAQVRAFTTATTATGATCLRILSVLLFQFQFEGCSSREKRVESRE